LGRRLQGHVDGRKARLVFQKREASFQLFYFSAHLGEFSLHAEASSTSRALHDLDELQFERLLIFDARLQSMNSSVTSWPVTFSEACVFRQRESLP
jgi:hypothetical protein